MKSIVYHEAAAAEVIDAVGFYAQRSPALAPAFLAALQATEKQIAEHPEAAPLVSRMVRRRLFPRFPYSLLYCVESNRIPIIAVAHQKQRPHYWRSRV